MDEVVWVKMTVNRRMAKSHGFYLQHAKEVCLVARKGTDPPGMRQGGVGSDIIFRWAGVRVGWKGVQGYRLEGCPVST